MEKAYYKSHWERQCKEVYGGKISSQGTYLFSATVAHFLSEFVTLGDKARVVVIQGNMPKEAAEKRVFQLFLTTKDIILLKYFLQNFTQIL